MDPIAGEGVGLSGLDLALFWAAVLVLLAVIAVTIGAIFAS
jgi:hypothetical protein